MKNYVKTFEEAVTYLNETVTYLNQNVFETLFKTIKRATIKEIGQACWDQYQATDYPNHLMSLMVVVSAFYLERLLGAQYRVDTESMVIADEQLNTFFRTLITVSHSKSGVNIIIDPYRQINIQGESLAVLEDPLQWIDDDQPIKLRPGWRVVSRDKVFETDWRSLLWDEEAFGSPLHTPIKIAGETLGELLTQDPQLTMRQFHLEDSDSWEMYSPSYD